MSERIVIHSDLNNFYASVEKKLRPELAAKPVAGCGNKEERRGIVLAKSEEAKRFGVKTGDTVWQAQRKCPDITIVPPHFDEYMKYSRLVKGIYARYTDLIEGYGIDECWLDVTHSTRIFPDYRDKDYVCHSWLLAPELKALLPEDSHILDFQRRFRIQEVDYQGQEYVEWVFKTGNARVADYPENTRLQKSMKKYLQEGGKIGNGFGVWIKN